MQYEDDDPSATSGVRGKGLVGMLVGGCCLLTPIWPAGVILIALGIGFLAATPPLQQIEDDAQSDWRDEQVAGPAPDVHDAAGMEVGHDPVAHVFDAGALKSLGVLVVAFRIDVRPEQDLGHGREPGAALEPLAQPIRRGDPHDVVELGEHGALVRGRAPGAEVYRPGVDGP